MLYSGQELRRARSVVRLLRAAVCSCRVRGSVSGRGTHGRKTTLLRDSTDHKQRYLLTDMWLFNYLLPNSHFHCLEEKSSLCRLCAN